MLSLVLLTLVQGFAAHAVQAQELLTIRSNDRIVALDQFADFVRDPGRDASVQDIMARSDYEPTGSRARMNFGYTQDAVWLRIPLQALDEQEVHWNLEMEYAYLDDIRLFVVRADGRIEEQRAGRLYPVSSWPLADRKPVFPVMLAAGEQVTLYIRGVNHAALALDSRLTTEQAFSLSGKQTMILLALYFGTLFSLGLYNLLLWIPVRQSSFLLYSLFEFSFGFAASSMNGMGPLLLWPDSGVPTGFIVPTFFTLAAMLAVLFARSFLRMQEVAPGWHRFLTTVALIWGAATIATLVFPPQIGLKIMSITGVLTTVSLLATGIAAMRFRVHAAGIYVAAWAVLLVGTSLLSIRNAGWIPSNFFTVYSMQIGSALEMLLLSFALGARFNLLKRQKEKVQQELVDTLREHERVLEARVMRRTEELLEAKAKLEAQITEDALTGIMNRVGLRQHFQLAVKRAQRNGQALTVMLIDLDGFKPVNDTHGHEAGDILLQTIASRLQHEVRETDAAGRLGGDEFVLIIDGLHEHELRHFAQRVLNAVSQPVDIGGRQLKVHASIGVCSGTDCEQTLKGMLRCADEAMYRVKRSGKNGIAIADHAMN